MHWHMMKWIMKWRNEQWNDEMNHEMWNEPWNGDTLEGLSKSVKHIKWSSALAYDEMNIHVKRGEWLWRKNVIMLMNVVTKGYEANVKDESNLKWA